MNITFIGSPNFDTNRRPIKQVVIHWFGLGKLSGVDATFQKQGGTSAHYAVEDETIHQYVKEEHVAYAVGVYSRNQETISIEHSAEPGRLASEATYQTSGKLIAEIAKRHNIPLDRQHIIGHKEIKATQCPGTIDIEKLINIAKQNPDELSQCVIDRDTNWNMNVAIFAALKVPLDSNNKEKSKEEAVKKANELYIQHERNNQTIIDLKTELEKIIGEDKDYAKEALEATTKRDDYMNRLVALQDALQASSIELPDMLLVIDNLKKPSEETAKEVEPVMDEMFNNLSKNKVKNLVEWLKLGINILFKRG